MTQDQINKIKDSAPVAFMQIKREHECPDTEAASILQDTMEVTAMLEEMSK